MPNPPPRRRARARWPRRTVSRSRFLDRFGECRHELEYVGNDPVVGDLEDVGVGILVDRDDHLARGHPGEMLDRAGNTERNVEIRRDRFSGLPDLLLVGPPPGVGAGARCADGSAERVGELLDEMPVLATL